MDQRADPPKVWCFTFGVQYFEDPHPTHPDIVVPNGWVEVEARDVEQARLIGLALFGRHWSGMYTPDEMGAMASHLFPRGCLGRFAITFTPAPPAPTPAWDGTPCGAADLPAADFLGSRWGATR